jgi:SAM-dependent methyltransferase
MTRELVALGASVTAVEPVEGMRALIEGAEAVEGTAESIPLPDASRDAVFVGEAFHWFDAPRALPEIARVLRPRGGLAMMWNSGEWEHDSPPWRPEVVELIAPVYRHPKGHEVPSASGKDWRKDTSWQGEPGWELFEELDRQSFEHRQRLTADDYVTLVSSWSFVAALEAPKRAELLDSVAAVLERHGVESFVQRWRTDLYLTRKVD